MTGIFCGKLFRVQCVKLRKHATIADTRTNTELSCAIHRQAAQQHDRVAKHASVTSLGSTHGKIAYHASKRKTCGQRFARHRKRRSLSQKLGAKNERPVRGRSEERRVGKEGRSRWAPDH